MKILKKTPIQKKRIEAKKQGKFERSEHLKNVRALNKGKKRQAKAEKKVAKHGERAATFKHQKEMQKLAAGHKHKTAQAAIIAGGAASVADVTNVGVTERTRLQEAERTEREKSRGNSGLTVNMVSSQAERV